MKLERPLVFFDIESAVPGLNPDPARDGIISLALTRFEGVRVVDDPGFGRWMLQQSFSENTKLVINRIFKERR